MQGLIKTANKGNIQGSSCFTVLNVIPRISVCIPLSESLFLRCSALVWNRNKGTQIFWFLKTCSLLYMAKPLTSVEAAKYKVY